MSTGPKQFGWWRRREHEAEARRVRGRRLSPERLRALASAAVIGIIAWTAFYWTYGSHRITDLDEFGRYLRGEDLYQKYEVSRLTWDCEGLRMQFDAEYLNDTPQRMFREDDTLVFLNDRLGEDEFAKWVEQATQHLAYGHVRVVTNDAMLVPAMMVRLFTQFRFESGDIVRDVRNRFDSKCRGTS